MWAQKHAKPGAFMTSYGRLKGVHTSENRELLQGILRDEWGFNGAVISDWWVQILTSPYMNSISLDCIRYGTYGVDGALNAGMDLEMPGPPRWRTPLLILHTLSAQKIFMHTIDERVTNLLRFIQRQAQRNPDVVYGDGEERSRDSSEMKEFCRKAAAEGIVLLKNDHSVLPLSKKGVEGKRKILVTGANVHANVISGGGSAQLKPTYIAKPLDSIRDAAGDEYHLSYTVGCYGKLSLCGRNLTAEITLPSAQVPADSRKQPDYTFWPTWLALHVL